MESARTRGRELRKDPTDAERRLWQQLRRRRFAGYRFRRQQPLGRYIVDFVCLEQRLILEVDGGHHAEQAQYDAARDRWLRSQGFRVLRLWDHEVLTEPEAVEQAIWQALGLGRTTPHPNPPPQGGRGLPQGGRGLGGRLDRAAIEAIIPHRAPFLFVDEIVEIEFGRRAVGLIHDVGAHAHLLAGHFPGFPVMPGALLVEALAEVGAVAALGLAENRGKIAMLTGLDGWRFRRPALPGQEVRLEATLTARRSNYGKGHAVATSGGTVLAEGDIAFAIVDRPKEFEYTGTPPP